MKRHLFSLMSVLGLAVILALSGCPSSAPPAATTVVSSPISQLTDRVGALEQTVAMISGKSTISQADLKLVSDKVIAVESSILLINTKLAGLPQSTPLPTDLVRTSEITIIKASIEALAATVSTLSTKVDTLAPKSGLTELTTQLGSTQTSLNNMLTALTGRVGALETRVSALEAKPVPTVPPKDVIITSVRDNQVVGKVNISGSTPIICSLFGEGELDNVSSNIGLILSAIQLNDERPIYEVFDTGTARFTKSSPEVIRVTGDEWTEELVGSFISSSATGAFYEVVAVTDESHLTIASTYPGASATRSYSLALVEESDTGVVIVIVEHTWVVGQEIAISVEGWSIKNALLQIGVN